MNLLRRIARVYQPPGLPVPLVALSILLFALLALPTPGHTEPIALWLTRGECESEQQDVTYYTAGEMIYLNGDNFSAGRYDWYIEGFPGQGSTDPALMVARGHIEVEQAGSFCLPAYVVANDDAGEYRVVVGVRHVTYQVEPAPTPTPTPIIAPPPPATETPIPLLPTWTVMPFVPTETPIIAPPPPATETPVPPPPTQTAHIIVVTQTPEPPAPTQTPHIVVVTQPPAPPAPTQPPIIIIAPPPATETPSLLLVPVELATATPTSNLVLVPTGVPTETPVVIIAPPVEPSPPLLPRAGVDRWPTRLAWSMIGLGVVSLALSKLLKRRKMGR